MNKNLYCPVSKINMINKQEDQYFVKNIELDKFISILQEVRKTNGNCLVSIGENYGYGFGRSCFVITPVKDMVAIDIDWDS